MKNKVLTKVAFMPRPVTFEEAEKSVQRVAAYARVSTDHEDQESSLRAQTDYYKRKIIEHGGWQFAGVFVDDGISGLSTNNREGFNRMIETCLNGEIDLVLTKSISRFARNTVDTVTTIRSLKEKGVGVYFEKENIFTLDSKGEFLLTIMSSLAQEESRSISENVKWGQRKRFADGKMSLGYGRFLGYDKGSEKYQMVVNEEQADEVRRIFFLFLQGYSSVSIAKIMERENAEPPGGKEKWWCHTVSSILQNEKYKGDALLQKEFTANFLTKKMKKNEGELPQYYVKEDHEAIISPWLFDYVQERMKDRDFGGDGRYSGVYVLSSKLVCGCCGATFVPRPWHSNDKYRKIVWQCRNRWRKPDPCKTNNVQDKALHYAIHDAARCIAEERKLMSILTEILDNIVPSGRFAAIEEWMRSFKKKDIMRMLSDEEDLSLIIRQIEVQPDKMLRFRFIDGSTVQRKIPNYSRKKNEVFYDE
jgi:site-specific DNA recombinase